MICHTAWHGHDYHCCSVCPSSAAIVRQQMERERERDQRNALSISEAKSASEPVSQLSQGEGIVSQCWTYVELSLSSWRHVHFPGAHVHREKEHPFFLMVTIYSVHRVPFQAYSFVSIRSDYGLFFPRDEGLETWLSECTCSPWHRVHV